MGNYGGKVKIFFMKRFYSDEEICVVLEGPSCLDVRDSNYKLIRVYAFFLAI